MFCTGSFAAELLCSESPTATQHTDWAAEAATSRTLPAAVSPTAHVHHESDAPRCRSVTSRADELSRDQMFARGSARRSRCRESGLCCSVIIE